MFGQPEGFAVVKVVPTEPVAAQTPALVIQLNDSITLKTYMHVDATVAPILKNSIRLALIGGTVGGVVVPATGKLEYHFQDLETGAMVPTIAGGAISQMTAAQVAADPNLTGLPATGDYYVSADTAAITTGNSVSAATLKLASATDESGTWRLLTHVHGGAGTAVSAFDDNLLIAVIT